MEYIDISMPLNERMLVWPGDPAFSWTSVATIANDGCAVRCLEMTTHSGTHVDAPAHFIRGGATIEQIPAAVWCGPALVVDATSAGTHITDTFLNTLPLVGVQRLLLRTLNSETFPTSAPACPACLTADAARYLRSATSVRLVGIDWLSIEHSGNPAHPVHRALLAQPDPVLILEGLDLRGVEPGMYELICLPLRLDGADGSPVRAVLKRQ